MNITGTATGCLESRMNIPDTGPSAIPYTRRRNHASRTNITSTATGCVESRMNIPDTGPSAIPYTRRRNHASRMNITSTGTRETASEINTSDRQSSATPSAGRIAFNASVTREIHPTRNHPQLCYLGARPSAEPLRMGIHPTRNRPQLCYTDLVHMKKHRIHPSCNRPQHRWLPGIAECTLVTKSTHAIQKPSSAARSQHVPSWQGNQIPTIKSGNIQAQQKAQHQTALSSDKEHNCQNSPQPQVTSISLLSTPCHLVYNVQWALRDSNILRIS
jgi:hypothetical protein